MLRLGKRDPIATIIADTLLMTIAGSYALQLCAVLLLSPFWILCGSAHPCLPEKIIGSFSVHGAARTCSCQKSVNFINCCELVGQAMLSMLSDTVAART